ncbi:MAG: signal peptidase II [Rickettsiales bacterium]
MNASLKLLLLIAVSVTVFITDLFSKDFILDQFSANLHFFEVSTILNIVLVKNYGISFGIMNDPHYSKWLFILFSSVLLLVLLAWYYKSASKPILLGLAMIIGGACGNLYDRLIYGAVIDFIDFHYATLHYPAFNIADSFIVIGVIILLFSPAEKVSE